MKKRSTLTELEYKRKYDNIVRPVHWDFAGKRGFRRGEEWCRYVPESVVENENLKLPRDYGKKTDHEPLELVDYVDDFDDLDKLNLHPNTGCRSGNVKILNARLNKASASCNPQCFRIKKPGKYCNMGTRNNSFSDRRHIGVIEVVSPKPSA
ncbi:hypothetical protein pdam_00003550 [Pocillopora damicornis]|uniref:Uncharacterized protein n=1 Tax=Pocillopora damicornis TaxID=46731 RepID=A0A3M6V6K1_POCDA|nr:hypothetical protein pdam_00003550 [Pocillopora damicornis]